MVDRPRDFDAVVVGAGISGMYLLWRLRQMGFTALAFEAGGDVGGTWYWNRYPGARCDIESMVYSYSFSEELDQEWTWSERYSAQPEILAYLNHVADRFDLRRDIRFETRVESAVWDEDRERWTVATDRGDRVTAAFLIMATGCLSVPRMPDLPGVDRFAGEAYHTGLWPHDLVDFAGKRVAIIGSGSSAVQSLPVIAAEAAQVTLFQRTPPYSVPAWNHPLSEEDVRERKQRYPEFRQFARETPAGNPWRGRDVRALDATATERAAEYEQRYRVGGFYLHSAYGDLFDDAEANETLAEFVRDRIRERVGDPELAELLCPYDYPIATKRMCIDTDYYETFRRPNVRLFDARTAPIEEITERGIRAGGEELEFDMIVYATGFDALTGAVLRVDIRGRGGLTVQEKWAEGPETYLGLAIGGFPNLFTITGPLSPSVLTNVMVSIEWHVDFVTDCMAYLREQGIASIEPSREAEARWVEHVRELGDASLYPRARSWYMGANVPGKPRVLLPYVGGADRYRRECERIVDAGYEGFLLGVHAH
jgi:cyclohexanone monooxygenase